MTKERRDQHVQDLDFCHSASSPTGPTRDMGKRSIKEEKKVDDSKRLFYEYEPLWPIL
jgi:hypothetical protein